MIQASEQIASQLAKRTVGKKLTVTAPNTPIFSVADANNQVETYDGLFLITTRLLNSADTNTASYVYHIGKHRINSRSTMISQSGLYSGDAADHPSFTFSIDDVSNKLTASPVGATSGDFYFIVTCLGNIKVY